MGLLSSRWLEGKTLDTSRLIACGATSRVDVGINPGKGVVAVIVWEDDRAREAWDLFPRFEIVLGLEPSCPRGAELSAPPSVVYSVGTLHLLYQSRTCKGTVVVAEEAGPEAGFVGTLHLEFDQPVVANPSFADRLRSVTLSVPPRVTES